MLNSKLGEEHSEEKPKFDFNINFNRIIGEEHIEEEKPRCIVRVRTSYWYDNKGIHTKKDINFLVKKSKNSHSMLSEEASNIGADLVFSLIRNLNECNDGLYEVNIIVTGRDWETGYVDDYEFELIPYVEWSASRTDGS